MLVASGSADKGECMANDNWDGKISNLKISAQAYPELHSELSSMYHKERSDRFRSLALIGLFALKGGGGLEAQSRVATASNEGDDKKVAGDKLEGAKDDIKGKLMGSLS